MSWKEILKEYKPIAHAGGKRQGSYQGDFDFHVLEDSITPQIKRALLDTALTNPDGSPKTMAQVAQEKNMPELTRLIADLSDKGMTVVDFNKKYGGQ
jgi:hypothetical protein